MGMIMGRLFIDFSKAFNDRAGRLRQDLPWAH